jgi:hypothetical protein
MSDTSKTEFYVRFDSKKHGPGMHETPCQTIEEAAGQFSEDVDCVSATKMVFDAKGLMLSAEDVTADVIKQLQSLIEDDSWTQCPHPMVEDFFNEWSAESERQADNDRDHERTESGMLNV